MTDDYIPTTEKEVRDFLHDQIVLTLVNDGAFYKRIQPAVEVGSNDSLITSAASYVISFVNKAKREYPWLGYFPGTRNVIYLMLMKHYELDKPMAQERYEIIQREAERCMAHGMSELQTRGLAPGAKQQKEPAKASTVNAAGSIYLAEGTRPPQTWATPNSYATWSIADNEKVVQMYHQKIPLIEICKSLGRSVSSILARLEINKLIKYSRDINGWIILIPPYPELTSSQPQPSQGEPAMKKDHSITIDDASPITEVTKTFVYGNDVEKMSESELINAIRTSESAIENLKDIKTPSKTIAAKIAEMEEQLAKIVAVLDAKFGK